MSADQQSIYAGLLPGTQAGWNAQGNHGGARWPEVLLRRGQSGAEGQGHRHAGPWPSEIRSVNWNGESKAYQLSPPRRGTDIFGLGIPNCKIIADWFAEKTGMPVFVPDLLEGTACILCSPATLGADKTVAGDYVDPASLGPGLEELEEPMAHKPFYQRWRITLGAVWAFGFKLGPRFLSRHGMGHVLPIAEKVRSFEASSFEASARSPLCPECSPPFRSPARSSAAA